MSRKETRVTLLQRLRDRQDEKSWAEFLHAYQPFLLGLLRQLGAQRQDAEDICQEVLVKAWKALPAYQYREGQCQFRTWLSRICRNTLRTSVRDRSTLSRSAPENLEMEESSEPEIDAIAEKEWQRYISRLAWENIRDRFSPHVQQCFQLCSQGQSSVEVGKQLGLAESSVRVNKQRVTAALCKEIIRLDNELQG
ncbi:MAG: hypothetical protein RL095_149 [Verrucomicrobiota bacterium]|jgi:RNA polymerase sigma factor (sigma-70 family)